MYGYDFGTESARGPVASEPARDLPAARRTGARRHRRRADRRTGWPAATHDIVPPQGARQRRTCPGSRREPVHVLHRQLRCDERARGLLDRELLSSERRLSHRFRGGMRAEYAFVRPSQERAGIPSRSQASIKENLMKRFHVHLGVPDLNASIAFYSKLFGAEPAVRKDDYAKWMLDDPRVNFAISDRGARNGLNHLGLQADSSDKLA